MTRDKSSLNVLEELIDRQAPLGDDWARSDLVSMVELFSNALTDGSFDSNVLIEIMEQLAQSDNPQQLRRLQTVMAASTNEFVAIYNDTKLEPR